MYKLLLPAIAVLAFTFTGTSADTADAQGFAFSNGRVQVAIGNPHRVNYGYVGNAYPAWGGGCHSPGWGWGGGHSWHDTSHYDWHPTEYRWHGNHWDVQPGHWDFHRDGHWDHHHP